MVQEKQHQTRVCVVDSCTCSAEGLVKLLGAHGCVCLKSCHRGVLDQIPWKREEKPDLVVLEATHAVYADGLSVLGAIYDQHDQNVVIFSMEQSKSLQARALALGARGWIDKRSKESEIIKGFLRASKNEYIWTTKQRGELSGAISNTHSNEFHLSPRELIVVRLAALGLSDKEIRQIMKITDFSLREKRRSIKKKTGLDRYQIVSWAMETGVLGFEHNREARVFPEAELLQE